MARKKGDRDESAPGVEDLNMFIRKLFDEIVEGQGVPPGSAAVYRFDISVNRDGITITPNTNGQVQSMAAGAAPREPLVDIVEGKEGIAVIAELPGVEKRQIELHADHERLSIKADSGKNTYSRLVELPSKVDPASATATYNNGVLEVSLKRSNTYRSIVKIDVK